MGASPILRSSFGDVLLVSPQPAAPFFGAAQLRFPGEDVQSVSVLKPGRTQASQMDSARTADAAAIRRFRNRSIRGSTLVPGAAFSFEFQFAMNPQRVRTRCTCGMPMHSSPFLSTLLATKGIGICANSRDASVFGVSRRVVWGVLGLEMGATPPVKGQ